VFAAVLWMPEEGLEPPTRGLCEASAKKARAEGKEVRRVEVERWTAQPTGSQAVEVATKAEAVRLADECRAPGSTGAAAPIASCRSSLAVIAPSPRIPCERRGPARGP
jgi:hypothetical protein